MKLRRASDRFNDRTAVMLSHNYGIMLFGPQLWRALRTKNRYSATSVDQLPHHLAAYLMFGHQLLLPVPDIDRTQFMLIIGANPMVSIPEEQNLFTVTPGTSTMSKPIKEIKRAMFNP